MTSTPRSLTKSSGAQRLFRTRLWGAALLWLLAAVACSNPTPPPNGNNPPPSGDSIISGSVTAPAGGDVQNTLVAACYQDSCDDARSKSVTISQPGASARYSIGELEAGTYSVLALKDVNGDSTLNDSDYAGLVENVTPPAQDVNIAMQVHGGDNSDNYSGTLIAEGTGGLHTLNLDTRAPTERDPWVQRDGVSVYEAAAVVLSQNELLIASDSFGSLMTVEVKDLTTFGLKESFEWSDDESVGRVNALAASRGGKHLAALLEGLGRPYLEVLDRDNRTVVYSGLNIVADDTMAWTPNDELVLALDLSRDDNPEQWGAIGVIPLERFSAATDERITIDLYATFTRAEWKLSIGDVAVSADGSQLLYTRGGDLWVMDFVPGAAAHQLTTGPVYKGGAQFSPDASSIAFVAGNRDFLTETYIIPNHRNEPLFIDHGQGAGDNYLIGVNTLVDAMLAWAP